MDASDLLLVYRLDGDRVAVAAELGARVAAGTMVIDPSFDFTSLSMFGWRPGAAGPLAGV